MYPPRVHHMGNKIHYFINDCKLFCNAAQLNSVIIIFIIRLKLYTHYIFYYLLIILYTIAAAYSRDDGQVLFYYVINKLLFDMQIYCYL